MSNIIIYQSEKDAGLEEQITSNASIAYASPLCPTDKIKSAVLDSFKSNASEFLSIAGTDDDDVYHTYSILVTSSWNTTILLVLGALLAVKAFDIIVVDCVNGTEPVIKT